MRRGGHHLEPQGSRATLSAVRRVFIDTDVRARSNICPMLGSEQDQAAAVLKSTLRARLKTHRTQLGHELHAYASDFAARAIMQLPEWASVRCLASYLPVTHEFDPCAIDSAARSRGMSVVYPRIIGPGLLEFRHWAPGEALESVQYGLRQPSEGAGQCLPADIDMVLVPLVGWDMQGGRLGYGGGYYDRVLPTLQAVTIGLGFECQKVAVLPRESHDRSLALLASEKKLYRFSSPDGVNG